MIDISDLAPSYQRILSRYVAAAAELHQAARDLRAQAELLESEAVRVTAEMDDDTRALAELARNGDDSDKPPAQA